MTRHKAIDGPLKIALAGAGMISRYHLIAWQKLQPRIKLVAICDPDNEHARRRADEFSVPRVYNDLNAMMDAEKIDALDVASPRQTHAEWVKAAAIRGVHVLCQKPLTPTLQEAEILVRSVADQHRLMVHENWRFRPWYRALKSWVTAGDLGTIVLVRMSMINSGFLPNAEGLRPAFVRQPFMQHESRLLIAETLIHHLDVMRFLCGELRVIDARTAHTLDDVGGETTATIFLENDSGAAVEVSGTMAAPGYPARAPDRLELIGSRASALFENNELRLSGPEQRFERYDADVGYQSSFDGVIAHFIHCLEAGEPFETDPWDNLETLRLVEHAYWAAGQRDVGSLTLKS
jgi:D-apiose dehydrogenase